MSFYYPDKYFSRISKINIKKDLINKGFTNVLIDVDNTILPRDTSIVPRDVKNWLRKLQKKDIKICLISNDWHKNVVECASELNLPIVKRALKPIPPAFIRALSKIHAKRKHTVVIGDQLLTDVFGAHTIGLHAYLVAPLVDVDLKHTLFLRKFENFILKGKQLESAKI